MSSPFKSTNSKSNKVNKVWYLLRKKFVCRILDVEVEDKSTSNEGVCTLIQPSLARYIKKNAVYVVIDYGGSTCWLGGGSHWLE